jgi:hypothetical protein
MIPGLRAMCTAVSPEGFVYMEQKTDEINMQGNVEMLKTSKRTGKLANRNEALLTDGKTTR